MHVMKTIDDESGNANDTRSLLLNSNANDTHSFIISYSQTRVYNFYITHDLRNVFCKDGTLDIFWTLITRR